MAKKSRRLRSIYNRARRKHPSIREVDTATIRALEQGYRQYSQADPTTTYLAAVTIVIVFVACAPVVFSYGYRLASAFAFSLPQALDWQALRDQHPSYLVALVFALFAIAAYSILPVVMQLNGQRLFSRLPALTIMPRRAKDFCGRIHNRLSDRNDVFARVQISDKRYIVFFLILYYVAWLFLLILACFLGWPDWIVQPLSLAWAMIPACIAVIIPPFFFGIVLVSLIAVKSSKSRVALLPSKIVTRLLFLLDHLDSPKSSEAATLEVRDVAVTQIEEISGLLRKLHLTSTSRPGTSNWAHHRVRDISEAFLSLSTYLYFPAKDSIETLSEKVCTYLNGFLSVDYASLPTERVTDIPAIAPRRSHQWVQQVLSFSLLSAYIVVPIVVCGFVLERLESEPRALVAQLSTIAYAVWLIVGLIHFSATLPFEQRGLLMELLRNILPKIAKAEAEQDSD